MMMSGTFPVPHTTTKVHCSLMHLANVHNLEKGQCKDEYNNEFHTAGAAYEKDRRPKSDQIPGTVSSCESNESNLPDDEIKSER